MIRWARALFHNVSISKKLLLVNLLVVVLPLMALYLFISSKLIDLTSKQFIDTCSQTTDQTAGYLNYKLTGVMNISDAAFYDPEKYLMISQDPATYPLPEQLFDAWKLKNFVNSLKIIDNSVSIHMYVNDELYYSGEEIIFHPLSRILEKDWLKELVNKGERLIWLPGNGIDPTMPASTALSAPARVETLAVVRRVMDQYDYDKTMAVLRVDLPMKDIEAMLGQAVSAEGSRVWLVDADGRTLARGDTTAGEPPAPGEMAAFLTGRLWRAARIGGDDCLLSSLPVGQTGLYLVAAFPKSVPLHRSDALRLEFLLIVLVVMAVSLTVSMLYSRALSKRLGSITRRMREVHRGNLTRIGAVPYGDEIGEMSRTYDFMVGRIQQLANERYELGREALGHEMSALQGQINPHFLYNMLDLVNLTALDRGMPDVAELVRMLARFYRLGLNRGRDTVTIANELEHVTLYLQMQNRRFSDRICFDIQPDEAVTEMRILKIVLQPIVENAVLHGILSERDRHGSIRISVVRSDGFVAFAVHDDGVGIPQAQLATLLDKEGAGYGLYNVHRRLCIFYGPDCGLQIDSVEGEGTTVRFRIPEDRMAI